MFVYFLSGFYFCVPCCHQIKAMVNLFPLCPHCIHSHVASYVCPSVFFYFSIYLNVVSRYLSFDSTTLYIRLPVPLAPLLPLLQSISFEFCVAFVCLSSMCAKKISHSYKVIRDQSVVCHEPRKMMLFI